MVCFQAIACWKSICILPNYFDSAIMQQLVNYMMLLAAMWRLRPYDGAVFFGEAAFVGGGFGNDCRFWRRVE